ncbi:MAG: fumarylacetoacetate hydrolase [Phenylobacterium sp.]|nr:fumarylacetoacetate hydrolase [Phenylobacterium sp.]
MRLATFTQGGTTRLGLVEGDEVLDLASADPRLPIDLRGLLEQGAEGLMAAAAAGPRARRFPLTDVRLEAPVRNPRKFLGLGLAYRSHADEVLSRGRALPEHQNWFNKQVTSVNGPYDPIHLPRVSAQLDYEGELALVIGRSARHVRKADAAAFIAGFMVCNDVSVRDWQQRAPTATLGKSFDTHGPIGPWLTTPDELGDPGRLALRTWVDGELRQDGGTAELIYGFGEMIEELSTVFTLEPGDILTTGTPSGVGQYMHPPLWLKAGQRVRVEIEGLGHIENLVIEEPGAERQAAVNADRTTPH